METAYQHAIAPCRHQHTEFAQKQLKTLKLYTNVFYNMPLDHFGCA
jgi:hypothetical protein